MHTQQTTAADRRLFVPQQQQLPSSAALAGLGCCLCPHQTASRLPSTSTATTRQQHPPPTETAVGSSDPLSVRLRPCCRGRHPTNATSCSATHLVPTHSQVGRCRHQQQAVVCRVPAAAAAPANSRPLNLQQCTGGRPLSYARLRDPIVATAASRSPPAPHSVAVLRPSAGHAQLMHSSCTTCTTLLVPVTRRLDCTQHMPATPPTWSVCWPPT